MKRFDVTEVQLRIARCSHVVCNDDQTNTAGIDDLDSLEIEDEVLEPLIDLVADHLLQ